MTRVLVTLAVSLCVVSASAAAVSAQRFIRSEPTPPTATKHSGRAAHDISVR